MQEHGAKAPPANPRRNWCFTVFNQSEQSEALLAALALRPDVRRLVAGRERCPTTGTPHLQGYIAFKRSIRFGAVKSLLPDGAHIEPREALKECQATAYCIKDGDVAINHGLDSDTDGIHLSKRDECDEVIAEIEQGATYGQIRKRHKQFCFWYKRNVVEYIRDEKSTQPTVSE